MAAAVSDQMTALDAEEWRRTLTRLATAEAATRWNLSLLRIRMATLHLQAAEQEDHLTRLVIAQDVLRSLARKAVRSSSTSRPARPAGAGHA